MLDYSYTDATCAKGYHTPTPGDSYSYFDYLVTDALVKFK